MGKQEIEKALRELPLDDAIDIVRRLHTELHVQFHKRLFRSNNKHSNNNKI